MKKFIFMDTEKKTELVLPVTPSDYNIPHGIKIETINIHMLGDVAIPGFGTLDSFKIECMFPAKLYPFAQPSAVIDPYYYVKIFEDWADNHTVLRFIVSDTMVNATILIENIDYGERDGTGDVTAVLALKRYRMLSAVQVTNTKNAQREIPQDIIRAQSYTIKSGDTLSAICRKYYGDASLYAKLAKYNGIKNANLISTGKYLKLPDRSQL